MEIQSSAWGPRELFGDRDRPRVEEEKEEGEGDSDLVRRLEALQSLHREQGDQIAAVVHDLRGQLTTLYGELELMSERAPPQGELAEGMRQALFGARRIDSLVGDLLVARGLEHAGVSPRLESVSLGALVRKTIEAYARRCQRKGVVLLAPSPGLDFMMRVDPALLRRVIENLLENALRYTPPAGRILIEARGEDPVEIVVSNDGPRIPLEERERIFENRRRGSAEAPDARNLGLGLYFCRRAIEAHGGTVTVVETEGWPTSFSISLPRPEMFDAVP